MEKVFWPGLCVICSMLAILMNDWGAAIWSAASAAWAHAYYCAAASADRREE